MKTILLLILLLPGILAVSQSKSSGYETFSSTTEYDAKFRYNNTNIATQPTYFEFRMYYFDNRDFSMSLTDTIVISLYDHDVLSSRVKMLPIESKQACWGCGVFPVLYDSIQMVPGPMVIPANTEFNGVLYEVKTTLNPHPESRLRMKKDFTKRGIEVRYNIAANQANIIPFTNFTPTASPRIEVRIRNNQGVYNTTCGFSERIWLGGATNLNVPH